MSMNLESVSRSEEKMWRKVINKLRKWLTSEDKNEWLKDMRGMLIVVATVIATLTFQVALNPPGGIRPAEESGDISCHNKMNFKNPCPGQAVLPAFYKDNYKTFLSFNTTCFASSLAVCLFLVSGLPLNNRFCTWLFSILMWITLTTLAFTYWSGVRMITPFPVFSEKPTVTVSKWAIGIWVILLGLVVLFLAIRLIFSNATKHINTWMNK